MTDFKTQPESNETHLFRYKGFGRKRMELKSQGKLTGNKSNTQEHSDAETDGQYDSNVDNDGNDKVFFKDGKSKCKHRSINNYQCKDCAFQIAKFGNFFDTGSISNYLRMCQASDTEDCVPQLGREVDLIYQSFEATNIIQMRDYMQSVIARSLVSKIKQDNVHQSAFRLLPTEALYSDTIPHVKSFDRYLRDFKEQKACVKMSSSLFIDSKFESGNIEKVFVDRKPES